MVCLVGAGGKTSAMFRLARELEAQGKKVLVTTTTAIFYPERDQYDQIVVSEMESLCLFDNISNGCITVFGRSASEEGKLLGVSPEFLDDIFLSNMFDCIIVEGDGSKGRPVKAPAGHEPVIPSLATKVLGVIGLDCIGRCVCPEYVHRPEIFCSITGCSEGSIINADIISRLIVHEAGLFKAAPGSAAKYVVLNKADGEREQLAAAEIIEKLSFMGYDSQRVLMTGFKDVNI